MCVGGGAGRGGGLWVWEVGGGVVVRAAGDGDGRWFLHIEGVWAMEIEGGYGWGRLTSHKS